VDVTRRWGQVLGLALLAMLILASYEAARPPIESLFLALHGAESLPRVWMGVAVGATLTVLVYNRLATQIPILGLLSAGAGLCAFGLIALLALGDAVPLRGYALYIFKDIYIVILLEAFWSYANTIFDRKSARRVYGVLLVAGTSGSLIGGELAGRLVRAYGTDASLWLTVPFLIAVAFVAALMQRTAPSEAKPPPRTDKPSFGEGFKVVRQSDYLWLILLLLLAVQLSITLVDYQFNTLVQAAYPEKDARSLFKADMYQVLNLLALGLQICAGFVLTLGVGRVFVGLPAVTGVVVIAVAIHPVVLMAAAAKVVAKAFDYSLFRASKEMLYIPLTYAEKTQGKAIIDMLTYRVAKGGAALLLQAMIALGLAWMVGWLVVGLIGIWAGLAVAIARRYRARIAAEE
jgi:AAA family ATP:ADP antiporter